MNIEKFNELELINKINNGDKMSEKIFYDKYKIQIYNIIKLKYNNLSNIDIEDSVSEIIAKVMLNLKNYDNNKSKLDSWISKIIINNMIDRWRNCNMCYVSFNDYDNNNKSYNTFNEYDNTYDTFNEYDDKSYYNESEKLYSSTIDSNENNYIPNYNFENKEIYNVLNTVISDKDINILKMKYVDGYNYNEIGKMLNMTSDTVSNKVNYNKVKIKNKIPKNLY